jgi:hypothetical protein
VLLNDWDVSQVTHMNRMFNDKYTVTVTSDSADTEH